MMKISRVFIEKTDLKNVRRFKKSATRKMFE